MLQLLVIALFAILAIVLIIYSYAKNSFYRELFELEEAFEGELDFIHLSKKILGKVLQKTAAVGGILYWYDETQKEYKLRTLLGIPVDRINLVTTALRQPQGMLEQAQTMSKCKIVKDIASCNSFQESNKIAQLTEFSRSLMVIPLVSQRQPQGVLMLFGAKNVFKPKHVRMFDVFAPRAAVNLDNSRLYQLAKETALENTRLYLNISKLYKQATLDELTGLYNRNFFMQRIKEEVKKAWRLKQPLSLLFLDLDYFKKVNDQYGHQVGDQLLMEFGGFIKKTIREYDVPCRFGGEEFIILLPHTKLNNAYHLAERIRNKVEENKFCEPIKDFKVTASFGVSSLSEFPEALAQIDDEKVDASVEDLISWADDALYRAKNEGRNQVKTLVMI